MDIVTLILARKYTDKVALGEGAVGVPGPQGPPGREIELREDGTYIQWRYVGAPSWTNLVALSDLQGEPGVTPEFRTNENTLQIKFPSDEEWTDLYTFDGEGDYEKLDNLPKINDVTFIGNRNLAEHPLTNLEIETLLT